MTAAFAIEASVLSAASILGVSKLYDLERYSKRWPDSIIAFGMVIGWMFAAAFSLSAAMLSLRGVPVDGAKWVLLLVVALTFATHAFKRMGLLKMTVFDDDQERDPHASVHSVAQTPSHRPHQPVRTRRDVA